MFRRVFIGMVAAACLSACGGGDAPAVAPKTVSIYGDSFTATTPSSAAQIQEFSNGKFLVTSYSVGGATTEIAKTGVPSNYLPFVDFRTQMLGSDRSQIVVLRYGIADAARNLNTLEQFSSNLSEFVDQARAAGKTVAMINMVILPETDYIRSSGLTVKLNAFNAELESVAKAKGVPVVDVRSNVTISLGEMYEDGLHVTPETTKKINAVIAKLMVEKL